MKEQLPGFFFGLLVGALLINTLWYWYVRRRYEPGPDPLNGDEHG